MTINRESGQFWDGTEGSKLGEEVGVDLVEGVFSVRIDSGQDLRANRRLQPKLGRYPSVPGLRHN